jgi:hypothetical protein
MRSFHARVAALTVATITAAALLLPVVRAQDDDEPAQHKDAVNRQPALEDVLRFQEQQTLIELRLLMHRRITAFDGTAAGLRKHLETSLTGRLDALQSTCKLTVPQRKKLQLAGRGDIKRLIDRIDPIFENSANSTVADIQRFAAETRDLFKTVNGLFDAGSLFSKTMSTTLTHEQFAERERALREENSAWYVNAVTDAVRRLAKIVDLSEEQAGKLSSLILTETSPPQKCGSADYAFVMFRASKLSEAKLREILDERQWTALKSQLASWADAESLLKNQGFAFDNGPFGVAKSNSGHPRENIDRLREHR